LLAGAAAAADGADDAAGAHDRGAAERVGRIWPWRIVGTKAMAAASFRKRTAELADLVAKGGFWSVVSGLKKPVPSPRALSTRRPASSTTVTVIDVPRPFSGYTIGS
jgi:hypothetical protein